MKSKAYIRIGKYTGIGNQMFQYCALQSLSTIKNFDVVVKKSWNYMLDKFSYIKQNQVYVDEINCTKEWLEQNPYDETFFQITDDEDIKIMGYFQDIKYFVENKEFIKNIFKFDDDMVYKYKKFLNNFKIYINTQLIAVVRQKYVYKNLWIYLISKTMFL